MREWTYRNALIQFCTPNQASALEIFRIDIRPKFMGFVTSPCDVSFVNWYGNVISWKTICVIEQTPSNKATRDYRLMIIVYWFWFTIVRFLIRWRIPVLFIITASYIAASKHNLSQRKKLKGVKYSRSYSDYNVHL